MNVILISGKARNGKTSTANILKSLLERDGERVLITHYGDLVKYVCEKFWGWNGIKDDTGRTTLQRVGTEVVRSVYPDYWVDFIRDHIIFTKDKWDYVLIPDVRRLNEIDRFRNIEDIDYITVRVERSKFKNPLTKEQQNHISETALDNYRFDYKIVAENITQLEDEVFRFYELLKGGDEE